MSDAAHPRYAGFWKRFWAYGYDTTLLSLLALLLMRWHDGAGAQAVLDVARNLQAGVFDAALARQAMAWVNTASYGMMALSVPYNILFTASRWQATPGKRWCQLKVANRDGSRLTLLQSTGRHAASGLSMALCGFGFLTIPFTREKTALHDMICNTRVIYSDLQ